MKEFDAGDFGTDTGLIKKSAERTLGQETFIFRASRDDDFLNVKACIKDRDKCPVCEGFVSVEIY